MTATTTSVRQAAIAAPEPGNGKRRRYRAPDQAGPMAYVILVFTAFLFIIPFYYMIVAGSRPMAEMNQTPPPFLPGADLWSNMVKAFQQQNIGLAIWNSLLVSIAITAATLLFCTLAGFAFAKLRFRGKDALFGITIATLMIPPTLGVVPLYMVMSELKLTGNLWSVILPTMVTAFGVFFMRQYILQTLPDELLEAARMDGATFTRAFFSIVLPIARPGMAVLGMLTFMTAWNEFFWPVIALNSSNPTVQVALNNLGSGYVPDQSVIMAGTLVGTLPVIIVFLIMGRQIVNGIMAGAVKG
ncbi:cellobiose transport system permease protein [Kineococcus xinjiangensis]|uniref:Cellobiose transport system permease protein n=1 Tax=Kineococcus xinjiangensis TaxID=512762 RepID=A0A2S6IJ92_9ACTN|nr:carbohydrate ABC transporter permease [Kineococcus xinjiangensis]PPK94294.1 cellobiose transport system permease protein [Kineococcus xinjiangensis]